MKYVYCNIQDKEVSQMTISIKIYNWSNNWRFWLANPCIFLNPLLLSWYFQPGANCTNHHIKLFVNVIYSFSFLNFNLHSLNFKLFISFAVSFAKVICAFLVYEKQWWIKLTGIIKYLSSKKTTVSFTFLTMDSGFKGTLANRAT